MYLAKNNLEAKDFRPISFTDIIDNFFNESLATTSVNFVPRADVFETENLYRIQLTLPGIKKEELKIDFLEGKLDVSGERKFKQEEGRKYHTLEGQYGTFKRSFHLPDKVNHEGIEAEYVDGILVITIPKDERKVKKASIQVK